MNIAFVVENKIQSGGAFSQTLNSLNDINKTFSADKKIIVFSCYNKNKNFFKKNNFFYYKNRYVDKIIIKFNQIELFRKIIHLLNIKISFEHMLNKEKVDLIIFPAPSVLQFSIVNIKFISTIFDLCHLINTPLSDLNHQEFLSREKMNQYLLIKSLAVITNSNIIKKQLHKRYKANINNIFNIPFVPQLKNSKDFAKKKFKYFFYPANYWKHKNHKIIIDAAIIILKLGFKNLRIIFTGFDKGYKANLNNTISKKKLQKIITIKNFVSQKNLKLLYKNASCLIMTSHYGPTNLPPLEAICYNLPIIYNQNFKNEFPENSCYMANVNKSNDLSKKMIMIMENKYKMQTKKNAIKFLDIKKKENFNNLKKLDIFIASNNINKNNIQS